MALFYGLATSPPAHAWPISLRDVQLGLYRSALGSGSSGIVAAATPWATLQPTTATFDLSTVWQLAAWCEGRRVQFAIGAIQHDGTVSVPSSLSGLAWNHASVIAAMRALIDQIYAVFGALSPPYSILLGEEVDVRLLAQAGERAPFAALVSNIKSYVQAKSGWSGVHVSASVNHEAVNTGDYQITLSDLFAAVSIHAVTYYPIAADYTALYNAGNIESGVNTDLATAAIGGLNNEPWYLAEFGFPSSATVSGSETLQALFVVYVILAMAALEPSNGARGLIYWFTHDLSTGYADFLGLTGNGRAFFTSVGLWDAAGTKDAWPQFLGASLGQTAFASPEVDGEGMLAIQARL